MAAALAPKASRASARASSTLAPSATVGGAGYVTAMALLCEEDFCVHPTEEGRAWYEKVARERKALSDREGLNHAISYHGNEEERRHRDLVGAAGEWAVCQYYGLKWDPSEERFRNKGPDIDPGREVRATRNHDWKLIVRDRDHLERNFTLVTGDPTDEFPHFKLRGWIWGREAARLGDQFVDDRGKRRWYVPQSALRPLRSCR